tara:strand:- start:437 stop:1972 length:1536 start_codon:yes stop_codon:yes gene_type:complete
MRNPVENTLSKQLSRRSFVNGLATIAAASAVPGGFLLGRGTAHASENSSSEDQRFLIVVGATGGANISDCFLPALMSQAQSPELANTIVNYPDGVVVQPEGSNIQAVKYLGLSPLFTSDYSPETFVSKYHEDMLVMANEVTSVNHMVAQKRSITGNGINNGVTLMEAMALRHGTNMPLPNVNMGVGGYIEPGDDRNIPDWARSELITGPALFAVSTHGTKGILFRPEDELIDRARGVREELDTVSPFAHTFQHSKLRNQYVDKRRNSMPMLEEKDLISLLTLVADSPGIPLNTFGLQSSPQLPELVETFPLMGADPFQTQAALAYLMIRHKVSSSVCMGLSYQPTIISPPAPEPPVILDTPLAFDFAHNDHLVSQNVMWARTLKVLDGLISLLQAAPFDPADPGAGSFWDRTLIYVATDFGRSKTRPDGSYAFGTGHHLNNGSLLISPLLGGNKVLGGIDHDTGLTKGFDLHSGMTVDGPNQIAEGHVYSTICQALDIDFPGIINMDAAFS